MGLIGGSGLYSPGIGAEKGKRIPVKTPYGSVEMVQFHDRNAEVYFLNRHGKGHRFPPHLIPYRANLWAMKEMGVERILAFSAAGSMNPKMKPDHLVLISDFIDFTKNRPSSFCEEGKVIHVDVSQAYCPEIRESIRKAREILRERKRSGVPHLHPKGIYVCTEGPRFETSAEIRAYRQLGGDVVGMTGVPEGVLARELGICYALVAVVTNPAAGISSSLLTPQEVNEKMKALQPFLWALFLTSLSHLPRKRSCTCGTIPSQSLLTDGEIQGPGEESPE